jgi:hypothetical protein
MMSACQLESFFDKPSIVLKTKEVVSSAAEFNKEVNRQTK